MPQYVFLLQGDSQKSWSAGLSPEEIQNVITMYKHWTQKMRENGHILAGHKLKDFEGRVVKGADPKLVVMDGPYVESKEIVGGLYVIQAKDYDEAVEIAKTCPHLKFGTIEIRQIDLV